MGRTRHQRDPIGSGTVRIGFVAQGAKLLRKEVTLLGQVAAGVSADQLVGQGCAFVEFSIAAVERPHTAEEPS
ncbi:MAG: hypothetical protein ABW128_15185 [Rhizorhabdus sp.]